jgi:hypothetical protein
LSRKKRQNDGASRSHTGKTSNTGSRPVATDCPSCNAATPPGAKYCHFCGKPLPGQPADRQRDPVTVALYSVIGITVAGTLAGIVYVSSENNVAAPTTPATDSSAVLSGQPVDLSTMSSREAADRLFNRVMMAEEQGDKQEVLQFAPKAIQAYGLVDNLDADAYYHIGLIHAAMGDLGMMRKQVEMLKQVSPDHLLGLMLEYDAAEQSGDLDTAAKAAAAFAAAYVSEIKAGRPEYEAHRKTVDKFFAENAGG